MNLLKTPPFAAKLQHCAIQSINKKLPKKLF